ncbi:MAG: 4Fe-4S binding protein [Ignavibacteriae bacterium]|nr:4Fe-4S binding protein [Ignavibacteriota bacterium]
MVFTLIGRELPVSFFKRSGIKMEGELSLTSKLQFLLLLFVAGVIYFGNSSADFYKHFFGKLDSFGDVVGQLLQEIFGLNIYLIRFNFDNYQTFVFIPLIVYKWGKGAYCGWICSCGALAETVGDDYRTLAPHGSKAKKRENIGQ